MAKSRKDWLEWFRVDRDVVDNPKILALSAEGGWDREKAVGRLVRLWCWVARHAPEGTLSPFLRNQLDNYLIDHEWMQDHSECSGCLCCRDGGVSEENGEKYGRRLAPFFLVGLLEESEDGGCVVHDWWDMNGYSLRERNRKRDDRAPSEPPQNVRAASAPSARSIPSPARATETETYTETETDLEPKHLSDADAPDESVPGTFSLKAWKEEFGSSFWPVVHQDRREAKAEAVAEWMKLKPRTQETLDLVCDAMEADVAGWVKERTEPRYIPHARKWLKDRRYLDHAQD